MQTPLRSYRGPRGGVPDGECNVARLFLEHDLFRKPVATFRDHALFRSSRRDDIDGSPDGRVYIQMRSIEQVRVGRRRERRDRARTVAIIAPLDIREDFGLIGGDALRGELARPEIR